VRQKPQTTSSGASTQRRIAEGHGITFSVFCFLHISSFHFVFVYYLCVPDLNCTGNGEVTSACPHV
jgi:hypothetical protein